MDIGKTILKNTYFILLLSSVFFIFSPFIPYFLWETGGIKISISTVIFMISVNCFITWASFKMLGNKVILIPIICLVFLLIIIFSFFFLNFFAFSPESIVPIVLVLILSMLLNLYYSIGLIIYNRFFKNKLEIEQNQ